MSCNIINRATDFHIEMRVGIVLLGKYAYSGTISASVNFEYFPFEVENPDDTPLEIAESIMPDFEMWRLTRELNLLDADPGLLYRPTRR